MDALKAGNDILLFPGDPVAAIEEAMASLADGTLDTLDIDEVPPRAVGQTLDRRRRTRACHGTAWEPKHAELVHRELLAQSLTMLPGHTSYPKTWAATQGHAVMLDLANHAKSCAPLEIPTRQTPWRGMDRVTACREKTEVAWANATSSRPWRKPPMC